MGRGESVITLYNICFSVLIIIIMVVLPRDYSFFSVNMEFVRILTMNYDNTWSENLIMSSDVLLRNLSSFFFQKEFGNNR